MARKIALVIDRDYGDRLRDLAFRLPVFLADTPENRHAVESLTSFTHEWPHVSMTLVRVSVAPLAEEWVTLLRQIELQERGIDSVEVVGAALSISIVAAFREAGFHDVVETPDGFRAKR